jgi:hypothetical protein
MGLDLIHHMEQSHKVCQCVSRWRIVGDRAIGVLCVVVTCLETDTVSQVKVLFCRF